MRFAKFDPVTTKAMKFKDKRSRVGIRADGTLRFDLAGKDKEDLRFNVFCRDKYHCVDGRGYAEKDGYAILIVGLDCDGPLELSHWPPMSKSGGSDEMATTFCRCRKHHRLLDNNQVEWTKKVIDIE